MKIKIHKCDNCKKIIEDIYDSEGWITFNKLESISITDGREPEGRAKTFFKGSFDDELNFCSEQCMLGFIRRMKK